MEENTDTRPTKSEEFESYFRNEIAKNGLYANADLVARLRIATLVLLETPQKITRVDWIAAGLPLARPPFNPHEYVSYAEWRISILEIGGFNITSAEASDSKRFNIVGYLRFFKPELQRRGWWSFNAIKKHDRKAYEAISSYPRRQLPADIMVPARPYGRRAQSQSVLAT